MIHGERGVAMNEQKQEGALAEGARRANGAKAPGHRSERGRFSCQRKREAVLRLLRGESLETLCRELGTTAARLSAWREAFLRGGEAALKARPADERDEENARLKAKVGELTMEGEDPAGEDRPPGGRPPFSRQEVEAMSQARFTSTGRAYGLKRVCALWGLARSTVYAQRRREAVPVHERPTPNKRGPVGPCTDAELLGHIRQVLEDSPFHGEGYRKVWARLRFAGIRTSKERMRRLMREAGLQAPHRVGKPRGPKAHNGTIRTERPDRMWGTDMTTTVTTEEGMASVFVAVDHCSVDCVGIHAAKSGNRFEALEPIRQGVAERFAGLEADVADLGA